MNQLYPAILKPEVKYMGNSFQTPDRETQAYFNSLPPMVQETIKQTGVSFSSKQELERYAANLVGHS